MTQTQQADETADAGPELATLTLGEFDPMGDTVAELDGESIAVFGGIPGERVVCRIVRSGRRKRRHTAGMVVEVLEPSPHRVSAPCPYFGTCTGCQWQHIDYGHQLSIKRDAVAAALHAYPELAGLEVQPTAPSAQELHYRNHARFTVRGGTLGFVSRITRQFARVDECMLMAPGINDILGKLQGRSAATSQLSIRYGINTGEWLLQPTFSPDEVPVESGQTHYRERLLDRTFRVASPSFFQVNTPQAERLISMVRERLELRGDETLVDAFAGVGTFAVLLAPSVGHVIAVEESAAAVKDAAINTLGIDNLEFREGKAEDILGELGGSADVVVLDPPRVGCQPPVLDAVVRWAPRRVCYVSCDPESLARDLQVLVNGGFRVDRVEPVDMFPQTHHIECIATLSRAE
jgi:23S rRNA (uracil1939-C5)-methyltransferase